MELLGDVGHVEHCSFRLEMELVLVQDRTTVYAKRTDVHTPMQRV